MDGSGSNLGLALGGLFGAAVAAGSSINPLPGLIICMVLIAGFNFYRLWRLW